MVFYRIFLCYFIVFIFFIFKLFVSTQKLFRKTVFFVHFSIFNRFFADFYLFYPIFQPFKPIFSLFPVEMLSTAAKKDVKSSAVPVTAVVEKKEFEEEEFEEFPVQVEENGEKLWKLTDFKPKNRNFWLFLAKTSKKKLGKIRKISKFPLKTKKKNQFFTEKYAIKKKSVNLKILQIFGQKKSEILIFCEFFAEKSENSKFGQFFN